MAKIEKFAFGAKRAKKASRRQLEDERWSGTECCPDRWVEGAYP